MKCNLSDVADVIDSLHKTPSYTSAGYPMIRVKDLSEGYLKIANAAFVNKDTYNEFTHNHTPQKGDIIISRVGSYGIVSLVTIQDQFCLGQNTAIITNFKKNLIDDRYLYYYMIGPDIKRQIENIVTGSTQKTISLKHIRGLQFDLPPLPAQRRIAAILSSLDDKIENNRCTCDKLEEMAQALFKQWFVDFEFPDADGKPYKSNGGEMVFCDELGKEVPKGWRSDSLSTIIDVAPKERVTKGTKIRHISMKELGTTSNINYQASVYKPYSGGSKFRNGDTLLARITPCLENGKTGFVDRLDEEELCVGSTEFIVMRSRMEYAKCLSYVIAREGSFRDSCIMQMIGSSGRQRVSPEVVRNYQLALPDEKDVVVAFGRLISPMFNVIKDKSTENEILQQARDTLLPKLMNGEIAEEKHEIY